MSWTARRSDEERLRAVRRIALTGQRDRLQAERDRLRRELAIELQRSACGLKPPRAVELEERIRLNLDEWLTVIGELSESQQETAA